MSLTLPVVGRVARTLLAYAAVLVLSTGVAHAQATWTGTNSAFWSDAGNWQGSVMPLNGPTGTALFPNVAQTAVDQNGPPWTLNTLTTTGASYTFSGGPLNFDNANATISVSTQPSTFNNQINWAFPFTLTLVANANITFTGAFLGTSGLVKQGPGTVTIATTLAGLGPVDVQAGVLTTSQTNPDITRSLTIAAGASVNTGPAEWAELSGAGNLALTGNTNFAADNDTSFTGNIIGAFAFTKSATGMLTLTGNNAWTGGTNVFGGMLTAGNGITGTFPSGPVNLNNSATLVLDPTNPVNITLLNGLGNLIVNGGVINGTGPWSTTGGDISLFGGTTSLFGMNIQGTLQVFAPATLTAGPTTVRGLEGDGAIGFNTNFAVNNTTDFTYSGVVSGAGFFIKDNAGTLTLAGANTWTGTLAVGGGVVLVNGSVVAATTVGAGATLGGSGNIAGAVDIPAGFIAPGASAAAGPGILGTGNLSIATNGVYAVDILGNAPGTGYDRLNVTGTVALGGTLQLSGSYVPLANDSFVIIANDGADGVTGIFAGLPEGTTIPFNGRTLRISYVGGTGNNDVTLTPVALTVTPSAGANGTIAPATPQQVFSGATTSFTITPNTGYTASVGGSCGGTFTPPTYTTATITANCTVDATFAINTYVVTASAGSNGTISPSGAQPPANHGSTLVFTLTPAAGYTASVGGTCGGNLVGNTYTTAPLTANCTVLASFGQTTFTVTPSVAGANGTISPNTPQTVVQGATTSFTITPNAGYFAQAGGSCGGTLVGATFTTVPITANCSVVATFFPLGVTTFTGPTATGTGNATASFTGGGLSCTFTNPQFIPVTGNPASPPAGTAPAVFAHGLFTFTLSNCNQSSTITMTITYPAALAPGSQYWKYGPEPGNATAHWYVMPATITGATVVFSITDGAQGDDDLTVNGTIVDQGGPGFPAGGGPIPTPTLSEWAMLLLASLLLVSGMRRRIG